MSHFPLLFCFLNSMMAVVTCHGSNLEDKIRVRQFVPPILPTFDSLWEANKHYIEAKKELLLGGVNKLKNNISVDDSFQELEGYVFFQFIHMLKSFGPTNPTQSYLTLGVSTEVCHVDIEGNISYKLSLVKELINDDTAPNGDDYVILLKMYADLDCSSVEFGKYLLPSFDAVEELEMYDNRLLITTSTSKASTTPPVPVFGTWLSVMPQDNEKLQYTVPPYIFAVGNNADIFTKISTNAGDLMSLSMECLAKSSISVSITTIGENKPTVVSESTAVLDSFVFATASEHKTTKDDPDSFHPKLSTSGLFASLLQHVQDPTTVIIQNNAAESWQTLKAGNLRVSQQLIADDDVANYDDKTTEGEYNYKFYKLELSHAKDFGNDKNIDKSHDKNIGDDDDKNISGVYDKNIGDESVTDTIAASIADAGIHGNDHVGGDDMFAIKNDDLNYTDQYTTVKWVVTVNCIGEE